MDNITVTALGEKLRSRTISPVTLIEQLINRAEKMNSSHNVFITLCRSKALEQARKIEDEINRGIVRGFLQGIPIGVKDNIHFKDVRITYGSKLFADKISETTATVLAKLEQAGAVVVGKTNLTEFSLANKDDDPYYGQVKLMNGNPLHDSNNGSGAAVSLGLSSIAVGTDSDGFLPTTATMAGVVSLRPSFGRVSRHGVLPVSYSLDAVCFFGKSVEDLAAVLKATAGFDLMDESSVYAEVPRYMSQIFRKPEGLKIGIIAPQEKYVGVERLMNLCDRCEFSAVEARFSINGLADLWTRIGLAEAAAFHDDFFQEWRDKYGPNARQLLLAGRTTSAVDYLKALKKRNEINIRVEKLFEQFHLLATVFQVGGDEESVDTSFGMPAALLGYPAVTMPLTHDRGVGLTLVGKPFEESLLLRAARQLECSRT